MMQLVFAPTVTPPTVASENLTLELLLQSQLPVPVVSVSDAVVAPIALAAFFKGDRGADGPPGPQGIQGIPGPPLTPFAYRQAIAASVWAVEHDLGRRPSVTTTDDDGNQFFGAVEHVSANYLTVTFARPVAGYAYLN